VYREYGKENIDGIFAYNKKAQMTGEVLIKVSGSMNASLCSIYRALSRLAA